MISSVFRSFSAVVDCSQPLYLHARERKSEWSGRKAQGSRGPRSLAILSARLKMEIKYEKKERCEQSISPIQTYDISYIHL